MIQRANIAIDAAAADFTAIAAPAAGYKIQVLGIMFGGAAGIADCVFKSGSTATDLFGSTVATTNIPATTMALKAVWGQGGLPLFEVPAGESLVVGKNATPNDVVMIIYYDVVKA